MRAFPESQWVLPFAQPCNVSIATTHSTLFFSYPFHSNALSIPKPHSKPLSLAASKPNPATSFDDESSENSVVTEKDQNSNSFAEDGVYIEVTKLEKNSRRIESKISIDAPLASVWSILTDYERLADFIPGLAVSQLLQKDRNFARLLQIGQQNLAFGIKFNAKGIIDCYEKELETLPSGMKREIEFKMIEGDFQLFEGKWSILQFNSRSCEESQAREVSTSLSYIVDVKPKLWLPVRLIEGRLCNEIKMNLVSIRDEALKGTENTVHIHQFE